MRPSMTRGEMETPGAFALSYPAMTGMGLFMLHLVFVILVGVLYTALA